MSSKSPHDRFESVDVTNPLSTEEIRAAAETHHELGPPYRDAVIESFLERIEREINARVDARLGHLRSAPPPVPPQRVPSGSPTVLAIVSMVLGLPLSAIAAGTGENPTGALGLIIIWTALAAINIAHAVAIRSGSADRGHPR